MGPAAIGGVMAAAYIVNEIKKRKEAKKAQTAMKKQRAGTLGYAGPENYLKNLDLYRNKFLQGDMPWIKGQAETGALGEQNALQALDADASRRGISGGVVDALRSGIRTGRTAQYNDALTKYKLAEEAAARNEANATSGRQLNASLGAPYTYVPGGPSWAQVGVGAVQAYAGGYGQTQANLGTGSGWQYQLLGKGGSNSNLGASV